MQREGRLGWLNFSIGCFLESFYVMFLDFQHSKLLWLMKLDLDQTAIIDACVNNNAVSEGLYVSDFSYVVLEAYPCKIFSTKKIFGQSFTNI